MSEIIEKCRIYSCLREGYNNARHYENKCFAHNVDVFDINANECLYYQLYTRVYEDVKKKLLADNEPVSNPDEFGDSSEMPTHHIADPGKMVERKLKPVDDNCLYKPVLYEDSEYVLIDIITGQAAFDPNKKEYFIYKNHNFCKCRFPSRIPDYDYGDGGNYE